MGLVEVAQASDVPAGTMKSYPVGDKRILIANIDGKFYAMNNICTHAGGELSKGKLEGTIVTCPRHSSKFDVTSGKCISGPKIAFLRPNVKDETVYEVNVEGNTIKINLPQ